MVRRKAPARPEKHQLNVAIDRDLWHQVTLAARADDTTQVHIVSSALRRYLEALPVDTKRLMEHLDAPRKKALERKG
jgi:hypothetical protein